VLLKKKYIGSQETLNGGGSLIPMSVEVFGHRWI